jgi:GNAT superfamily N-acetyltransferase
VKGFYTLSMADVPARELPVEQGAGLPKYPLPVVLIGRLAVELRAQGHGIGQRLLVDALARTAAAAQHVAFVGVIVDAKNAAAVSFYERFGFKMLYGEDHYPRRMYLTGGTIPA